MSKPILCVDFDGVIHKYVTPWTNAETIADDPVDGALEWLYAAQEFFSVQIYSSRSKSDLGLLAMTEWIWTYAKKEFPLEKAKQLCENLTFAHEKPPAFLTIDDRAICFEGRWADLDPKELLKYKPWNKRK